VEIHLSDTKIRFDLGPVHLTSKLIDGTFPEYDRVIPRRERTQVLRGRKRNRRGVGRVAAISSVSVRAGDELA
jgi:DNA polymerase-3 subunit beta